ncbi:MAG: alpha-hydroxy acid oxidase, partial [Alphaproteobacteria bacterium]
VHNIADMRAKAKARLPKMVFDYIDGGADDELTLANNNNAFRQIGLLQNVLVDVSHIETRTKLMGGDVELPFVICPTATSRLFHPRQGERAVAKAAADAGMAYSFSTLGSVPFEEITQLAPGPKWFQLYVWKDRPLVLDMLAKAKAAGFSALILTVDTPVAGNRERDPHNDFSVPPKITPRTAWYGAWAPRFILDVATTSRIGPVNVDCDTSTQSIIDLINDQFDPSVTWDYVEWLRSEWEGPIAIKGISKIEDARRAVDIGADCIWISNHGGRQLDTAPATVSLLPNIADAVGSRAEIILDGGIRRGSDIVKALALGADGVGIGRAYLYGLAAAGEAGVAKSIAILAEEFKRTMALVGVNDVKDLNREVIY